MPAYLDNSATTRPTDRVIAAMAEAMRNGYYNPSSLYGPALNSEKAMKKTREEILRALGVSGGKVVFTSGGTEANNLAIMGAINAMRGAQKIIVSAQEHPSVLEACERLAIEGHRVSVLPVDGRGELDWDALSELLKDAPSLVSCMQVNNETGAMPDIDRLIQLVRAAAPDALIHVDGVQGFMRTPLSMKNIDMYTLSAHKLNGPKGVGALWVRKGVRLSARQIGGGQEDNLRSGTENTPGIAGLMEAMRETGECVDVEGALRRRKLRLWRGIQAAAPEAVINGPSPDMGAPHILNISFPGVRAEVMLHALEAKEVYCSTGSACSSRKAKTSAVLKVMGIPQSLIESALRFSLCIWTTDEEIDYAVDCIREIYPQLKRFVRR